MWSKALIILSLIGLAGWIIAQWRSAKTVGTALGVLKPKRERLDLTACPVCGTFRDPNTLCVCERTPTL
jgi:hypothetical protein